MIRVSAAGLSLLPRTSTHIDNTQRLDTAYTEVGVSMGEGGEAQGPGGEDRGGGGGE